MGEVIVRITEGQLQGCTRKNLNDETFLVFLGIPYAKPPTGDLRFKAPVPAEPWLDLKDATNEGNQCIQRDLLSGVLKGHEDCLNLNVFTKALPSPNSKPKPVMVWIHGGAFLHGSNSLKLHGPEHLMTEDIVLVTINYRLGALGFLSTEESSLEVPGNAGLKDQVLALKWVQRNIKYFNGDPNNVTVFGESAGGVSVHFHLVSPASKGLFHKAIMQSGNIFNPWAMGMRNSVELARYLEKDVNTETDALRVLTNASALALFEAQEKYLTELKTSRTQFGAVIESPNDKAFLTKDPVELVISGEYTKVPILLGYTSNEGMLFAVYEARRKVEEGKKAAHKPPELAKFIQRRMDLEPESEAFQLICQKLKKYYFTGENAQNRYLLPTDCYFVAGVFSSVFHHIRTSVEPVYLYRITLDAGLNLLKRSCNLDHIPGVCHADELGYIFKNAGLPVFETGSVEDIAIRRFVKLWTNFAKHGDPTPDLKDLTVIWKHAEEDAIYFLDIGEELVQGKNPEAERWKIWQDIFQLSPSTSNFL